MKTLQGILILLVGFLIGAIVMHIDKESRIKLPLNYENFARTSNIIGYYDEDRVLHIEYDNRIQFEWEGHESDIPRDGIRTLQLTTNENTVYLNPVDE